MIYKTIYTISIDEFSRLLTTDNYNIVCKIWLPKYLSKIGYVRLMNQYNELFNKDKIKEMFLSDAYKLILYNTINNTLKGLRISVDLLLKYEKNISKNDIKIIKEEFKKRYGIYPEKKEHIQYIDNEIRKKSYKLKEANKQKTENNITFEDVIFYVQSILNIGYINRDMSLYAFYTQYKEATKKIKQNG